MTRRHRVLEAVLLASALSFGCARALRVPPSARVMAGSPLRHAAEVGELLESAERDWARREADAVRRAQKTWLVAAAADEGLIEGLIGAARAAIWLAGSLPTVEARQAAALEAVQAAQLCGGRRPDEPVCDYWLAVALGVQARERRSTALDALPRMAELLESAAARRPELEWAGPDRVLALLLLRAPGWPTGPGDSRRGLERARRAVEIAPGYPPNLLCLAEALSAVGEGRAARETHERGARLVQEWIDRGDPDARGWLGAAELAPAASPGYKQEPRGGPQREEDP